MVVVKRVNEALVVLNIFYIFSCLQRFLGILVSIMQTKKLHTPEIMLTDFERVWWQREYLEYKLTSHMYSLDKSKQLF